MRGNFCRSHQPLRAVILNGRHHFRCDRAKVYILLAKVKYY